MLNIVGSEHLRFAPCRDARSRVHPVRQVRGRVDKLGDFRLRKANCKAARAVPSSERLRPPSVDWGGREVCCFVAKSALSSHEVLFKLLCLKEVFVAFCNFVYGLGQRIRWVTGL